MLKNSLVKNLEQNLPPRAQRMVTKMAMSLHRDVVTMDADDFARQLDVSHAVLHMRLYQRYGANSSLFSARAHSLLDELVADYEFSEGRAVANFEVRPSLIQRFS